MSTIDVQLPEDDPSLVGGELSDLCARRAHIAADVIRYRTAGDLDNNDPYHQAREALSGLDRRILEIRERAAAEQANIDDGTVRPFSQVTVMFNHDVDDIDTLVLTAAATNTGDGFATCSPLSPLGSALLGCRVADEKAYLLPNGTQCVVTVLSIATGLDRRLLHRRM
nr:GreA/GreB family elongation factor [Rhodococcus sp. (in: high G+C Gram-positive bacteria)]